MHAILRSAGLGICIAAGLISLAAPVYADTNAQTLRQGTQSSAPTLRQGQKWETDEVLRQGMDNIRRAMIANREAIKQGQFSTQDYQRLAAAVDQEVAGIVKNCKLSKEADKAFHVIVLADLAQSTESVRTSPKVQAQRAWVFGALQSLRNYGEYFQHSGWHVDPAAWY